MTNYLEHHGIHGMKWGIRRFQNKDGSLKKAGRERYNTKIDQFTLRKGTELHRLSTVDNERHFGKAYATFKSSDTKGYMKRSLFLGQKSYDMTMVVTKDLVSPSKKERVDAFLDLCKKDGTFFTDLATAKQALFKCGSVEEFKKKYQEMTEAELRTRAYNDLAVNIGFDDRVQTKYFSELSDRGYNMIIDDADAQLLADSPIIVFDRADTLEVVGVNRVTREYIKNLK